MHSCGVTRNIRKGYAIELRWPDASVGSLKLGLNAAELWAFYTAMLFVRHCVGAPGDSTNVCIDVDRVPGRSMSGEGGHWVVTAHRSGKRALATKFSAHKVSLLDINGIRTPDPRFVSGARTDCAGNGPGDRAVEWDPCNRSSGPVARRSGSMNWN